MFLKLFVLLYADDNIHLSETPEDSQHQLNVIREDEPLIPFHILPLFLDNTGNKKSYKILNYSGEIPTGLKKWNEYLFLFTEQVWEKINVNVFKTTNDKKIQWLQYRINQRILTTNTFL